MDIEILSASDAKKLADSKQVDEMKEIMINIKEESEKGNYVLHIYKDLRPKTLDNLATLGFVIITHPGIPGIAKQKDGLYYSIKW